MRETHVAFRFSGELYIFQHMRSEAVRYTARSTLPIVRSSPYNLFLKRPVVMSVRNVALSYAMHGYRCRVARKIFSGISERKRNVDELAL